MANSSVEPTQTHESQNEQLLADAAALHSGVYEIANALSERQIFEALFKQLRRESPHEILAYYFNLVNDEPLWADLKASWHVHNEKPKTYQLYLPEAVQANLLTGIAPRFIEDVVKEPDLSAPERESFAQSGAASAAILPLSFIGEELGSIIIYFSQPRTFPEATRRFWLAMIDQTKVALSNRLLAQQAVYRVVQMETAAEVARAASSLLDVNGILNSAVALIRNRFDVYFVGAYLIDDTRQWAKLRAGTGEAGRLLLEDNHKLKIGGDSIVSLSIDQRQPRVALDVGKNAVRFQNPHLPETRSEMVLPLMYRNQAIGAFTIQSEEQAAFGREDIIFLQTMADQLANALENAKLFEQAQQEIRERQRAEAEREQLLTEVRRLAAIVENHADFIGAGSLDGQATYINPAGLRMMGLPPDYDISSMTTTNFYPPEDADLLVKEGVPVALEEGSWSSEAKLLKSDGTTIPVEQTIGINHDAKGQPYSFSITMRDITARKQAQEALQYQVELEELMAVTSQYFINLTPDEVDDGINRALQAVGEFFQVDRSYVFQFFEGGTKIDNTHEWHTPGLDPEITNLQDMSVELFPWWMNKLNGFENVQIARVSDMPLEAAAEHNLLVAQKIQSLIVVPMVYGGSLVGFLGCASIQTERNWTEEEIRLLRIMGEILVNALERKRAEEALWKSEKEYQELYDNSPIALITLSQDGHIYRANESMLNLLRYSWDELIDRSDIELYADTPAGKAKAEELNQRVIATGQQIQGEELEMQPADGPPIWVSLTIQPIWNAQGQMIARQASIEDITERKRAEVGLIRALERTESLYRIGDAIATATNQQTILSTVLGEYLRLLNLKWGVVSLLNKADESRIQVMYVDGQPIQPDVTTPVKDNQLFQHLAKNKKPLKIGNVYTDPLTKHNQLRSKLRAKSMLFIPIELREQVIGIISAGSQEEHHDFSQSDIETGLAVADQLAVWIENRQLLAEAQYRSERLQTAAEVSRAASSILDMGELIETSVNYIHDRFEVYYVGLFLVDEAREWAVLRAGTGKAGQLQLERNHRLEIGGASMIGWSVANRKARIAFDVGQEGVRFINPLLPETRSEMALPLISRDEVVGALTVQSVEHRAFSHEDITLLQTMADQLANAIVNARLFENAAQARQEAEARLQETIALQRLSRNLAGTLELPEIMEAFFKACTDEIGFEYVQFSLVDKYQNRIKAVSGVGVSEEQIKRSNHSLDDNDIMADIIRSGETEIISGWDERFDKANFEAEEHGNWVRIFTPITLRQENIGLVEAGFNKKVQASIQDFQIRSLIAFINQTALALDNAQRYEASQRAARREALIKEITTKVRASTDLDTILQTTVKEVGEAISSNRAYIHLVSSDETNGSHKPPAKTDHLPNGGQVHE